MLVSSMDSSRLALVIFLLLFLFFSPDSQAPSLSQQRELDYSIQDERHALNILNTTDYGGLEASQNRWLNVTGLRRGDGYAWESLPKVQDRAKEQLQTVLDGFGLTERFKNWSAEKEISGEFTNYHGAEEVLSSMTPFNEPSPMYRNVTGIFTGQWVRSRIEPAIVPPSLNLSELAPRIYYTSTTYNRNITGQSGDLRVQIEDRIDEDNPDPEISTIKAQISIKDETSTGDGWEISLFGVHYPQQGGILLSTTSEKFAGIFTLPHYALSKRDFNLAQRLLNKSLAQTIEKQEADFTSSSHP